MPPSPIHCAVHLERRWPGLLQALNPGLGGAFEGRPAHPGLQLVQLHQELHPRGRPSHQPLLPRCRLHLRPL